MLQEGGPLPGPEIGLLSNITCVLEMNETHMLKKQDILLGKGAWAESRRVREPRRTTLSHGLQSRGFMVMGLVSGLSLANHLTQSPSWWCTPCSAKMYAREKDSGRWSDMCNLLLTFSELFWLVEA